MKLKQNIQQLNVFDHLISQKVRSFRTFSKYLEALQYENSIKLIRHVAGNVSISPLAHSNNIYIYII